MCPLTLVEAYLPALLEPQFHNCTASSLSGTGFVTCRQAALSHCNFNSEYFKRHRFYVAKGRIMPISPVACSNLQERSEKAVDSTEMPWPQADLPSVAKVVLAHAAHHLEQSCHSLSLDSCQCEYQLNEAKLRSHSETRKIKIQWLHSLFLALTYHAN